MNADLFRNPTFGGLAREHYGTNHNRAPVTVPSNVSTPLHSTTTSVPPLVETSQPIMPTNFTIREPRYLHPSDDMRERIMDDLRPQCVCFLNKAYAGTIQGIGQASQCAGLRYVNEALKRKECRMTQNPWTSISIAAEKGKFNVEHVENSTDWTTLEETARNALSILSQWIVDGVIYTSELDQYRLHSTGGILTLNVSLYGPQLVTNNTESQYLPFGDDKLKRSHIFDDAVQTGDRLFVSLFIMTYENFYYFQYHLVTSRQLYDTSKKLPGRLVGAWYLGVVTDRRPGAVNGLQSLTRQLDVFINPSWVDLETLNQRYPSKNEEVADNSASMSISTAAPTQYIKPHPVSVVRLPGEVADNTVPVSISTAAPTQYIKPHPVSVVPLPGDEGIDDDVFF